MDAAERAKRKAKRVEEEQKKQERVAQVIADGGALIRARGWCVGGMEDGAGRLCMMGGIREAALGETTEIRYRAYDAVNKHLGRQMQHFSDEQTSGEYVAQRLDAIAVSIHPGVKLRELCPHKVPICPDCRLAIGCHAEYCSRSRFGKGHDLNCPQRVK